MKLQLLFCKTTLPFSKVIMWATEEKSSHVAVTFDSIDTVWHSDLVGLHASAKNSFMGYHTIVNTFTIDLSDEDGFRVQKLYRQYTTDENYDPYDFPALIYFGWRCILRKFFKIPFPKINPWATKHTYLCTEQAYLANEVCADVLGKPIIAYDLDLAITTPGELYSQLCNNFRGQNEVNLSSLSVNANFLPTSKL